jgi:hypothetical protein
MKIKDILGEDDNITIKAVSGDKAELSNGQQIDAKTLTPDSEHPGQFKAPQMDPNAIKPGAVVNMGSDQAASEDVDSAMPNKNIPSPTAANTVFVKNASPMGCQMSDGDVLTRTSTGREVDQQYVLEPDNAMNRVGYVKGKDGQLYMALNTGHKWKVGPEAWKKITGFSGNERESMGDQQEHQDLVGQGNHDVGGDATDKFINDIRDREFERKNRNPGSISASAISGRLKENDELMKWLTIAGLK